MAAATCPPVAAALKSQPPQRARVASHPGARSHRGPKGVNCGSRATDVANAQTVFHALPQPNVTSWNALLLAHSRANQSEKVLQLYRQMQEAVVSPNDRTLVIAIQACGRLGERELINMTSTNGTFLEKGPSRKRFGAV